MKYVLPTAIIAVAAALAGCDRPVTTSSTTVVKEPTTVAESPAVVKEKETIIQRDVPTPPASTTIVNPPAQPGTTERSRTTTTSRIDTPMGTATETRTESTKTSQ